MSLILCSICDSPATGTCPLSKTHVCGSICQNISYVKLISGKTKQEKEEDPNDRDKKKIKEEEEEETDPFTLMPISELEPNDVIVFQGNRYSLNGLYRWFINDKKTRNPLKGNDVNSEDMNQVVQLAIERFPFRVDLSSLGHRNRVVMWTSLSTLENLAFHLIKITVNVTVDTLMEYMTYCVRRNLKLFLFNPDRNILDLIENDVKLAGLNQPLNILITVMLDKPQILEQVELCIRLAEERGKGHDMFDERARELRRELNPNQQELTLEFANDNDAWVIERIPNESLYDAFLRVFNDHYDPPTNHDEWIVLTGMIVELESDARTDTERSFPLEERDFENLEDEPRITVRITEEYNPPIIEIEFVVNEQIVDTLEVEPEEMLNNLFNEERLRNYANTFRLPIDVPREGMYEINIIMEWSDEEKKTFVLGTVPNIFYEIFKFMEELRGEFYQQAGPWIDNDRIEWTIRVEYNSK